MAENRAISRVMLLFHHQFEFDVLTLYNGEVDHNVLFGLVETVTDARAWLEESVVEGFGEEEDSFIFNCFVLINRYHVISPTLHEHFSH